MRFRAIEAVLPSMAVDNDQILERVRVASRGRLADGDLRRLERMLRFVFRSMGTHTRYGRAEGELPSELCAEAGRRALHSAELDAEEIDLVLYVGVGRGFIEPATANVFQDLLGLRSATCFDILDACASWLRAVHVARAFIESGVHRNVLILNAEFNANYEWNEFSNLEEYDWRFPQFTIGEAATATIVSGGGEDDEYAADFRNFGDQRDRCLIPLENYADYLAVAGAVLPPNRFVSHGSDLMTFGLDKLVEQYHKDPGFRAFDPDLVFFHAASDGMAREGMRRCGLDEERGYYTHARFGNTVSASVPLAMAHALREGRLSEGDRAIVAVASAGVTIALARFVYRS